MTAVMPALRPATSGLNLTTRAIQAPVPPNKTRSTEGTPSSTSSMVANPALSIIEIEALLRDKVKCNLRDLQQAFQNYDVDKALSITKGEFRRVLEAYCLALTTEQFEAVLHKVETNPNGTIRYCDFLEKFSGGAHSRVSQGKMDKAGVPGTNRFMESQSPKEMNTDMIEKMLREKIIKNTKNIAKAMRLYDYNRDNHIQRHELRKVLENYCFKMTDPQFDKLYQRYDFHHRGVLNYKDFLERLGVPPTKPAQTGTPAALSWNAAAAPGYVAFPKTQPTSNRCDDAAFAGMSIHEIEVEFRKKMVENYVNLKRMFLAFDQHLDGFIQIEDLRSVLNNFVFPMSDQLFAQLMDRLRIKASGKISWEFFLEKFQDPQSNGNGQTVPIGKNHKFFPIRGVNEKVELKDLIRLLHAHVKNGYSSFKHAFLELDKTRCGKISRKEMRKVMDTFKIQITSNQFKELMILLDPQHTNFISYHRFLDLFEERETKEGHKWLKSCHKFNDKQKPAILAWNTIEDLLREKIALNWKDIASTVVNCDSLNTGKVYPKELRQVIERFCLPISDDHFESLVERVEDKNQQGKLNYVEFFSRLGVTVAPGDTEGLSTQIQQSHDYQTAKHAAEQGLRHEEMDTAAQSRTTTMSADEIITRLKDKFAQRDREIRSAFTKYDKTGKGKVSKKVFREVLERFGFYMTDEIFKEICTKLSFTNGHMNYLNFVTNFEDPRLDGPAQSLVKPSNHRVNPIRGDEYGIPAEQVEAKLRQKLRENFEGLRGAFYKFDDDHNGVLTKGNFRRMLDSFMLIMTNEEFEKFCAMIGLDKKSRITYLEFLNAFEVHDSLEEGHKWLKSDHRYNETQPMQLMSAEEVHKILAEKAHRQWADLAKAFRTMDSSSDGVISRRELRDTLYRFMLPMSKTEFNKLWSRYDEGRKGFVSHQDFLQALTGDQFAPGDQTGTSKQITVNSYMRLAQQHAEQQAKQEQLTLNQANRSVVFTVEQVLQQLKDRIREQYEDFQTAFKKYDKKKKGYLTSNDIQRILVDFHYYLDDDQFYDLLEKIGLSDTKKNLPYEKFLKAFEEGRKDNYKPKSEDHKYPQTENGHLSPEKAEEKMRAQMAEKQDLLKAAFLAFDRSNIGSVGGSAFKRVLDNFCFKMTDAQYKHFMSSIAKHDDGSVDYNQMMESVGGGSTQDMDNWMDNLRRQLREKSPHVLSLEEVQENMRELVTARFKALTKAFSESDYAKIGVIAKEEFRDIIHQFTIRLTDEQFEKFWANLPVNEFGNLDYQDFLRSYTKLAPRTLPRPSTSAGIPPPNTYLGRRPLTSDTSILRDSLASCGRTTVRPYTPMVNAEDAEQKLKEKIHRHWKDIQRMSRALDDGTGVISQGDFRYIIEKHNLGLSEEDINKLLLKYDLRNNNTFSYTEFLKHFVLNMRSSMEESQLLSRKKIPSTKITATSVEKTGQVEDAMARVRATVMSHWKDMRKDFRSLDVDGQGTVSTLNFRQIMRNYNVNLSEDEFFNLMTFYDKRMNGHIAYNDFVKNVLRSQ